MRAMSTIEHFANRTIIRLGGEDRRTFLQGLISQDIERLTPEAAIFTALLTPQGKILFDFFIAEHGDTFFIDCDKDTAPLLAKRLTLYRLRAKVVIEIDETLMVMASEQKPQPANGMAFADPRLPALGWRIIAPKGDAATDEDYDLRRIGLGVPEFGKDFKSEEVFLLDVNYDALNAVSYKKGCFVGQEVTSRMKRKGMARKRTLIAEFEGDAPARGMTVTAGESTLGETLSGAEGRGLALIRLDRWAKAKEAGKTTTCEGVALRLQLPDYLKQG